jgi:hypothetical protein
MIHLNRLPMCRYLVGRSQNTISYPFFLPASLKVFTVAMAMLQNFALQKEKMKAKYLKHYFTNALLVIEKVFFCFNHLLLR